MITRRSFLSTAALAAAATRLHATEPAGTTLHISSNATGPEMPPDFVGLSYEVQQLVDAAFFSAQNTGLIRQFRALSARGVLRLGGNTSEYGYWKPTADTPEPAAHNAREVTGQPKDHFYAVTPEAVRNLADFLGATGWTCIYGIGMGNNTPERAAVEAVFVQRTLGQRLQYFQIGNEADLFGSHLRDPRTWGEKAYLEQWLAMARAITARVPGARFGMPDVASRVEWLTEIAADWPSIENPPDVTTLTHHYYFGGPATNPEVNIPNLLKAATMAKVQHTADIARAAADKMKARVRMTEGNTCYRGGKPGVSDVFAASLWSADYSLLLAANNYSGVNLHGGTGRSVANSVGGFLPGDAMLRDEGAPPEEIASHPHPFYTPIATFGTEYMLEPVAYGLKFAGSLAGGRLFDTDFTAQLQATGVDATAYAAEFPDGRRTVIVLNKDLAKDVVVELAFERAEGRTLHVEALRAPAVDSRQAHIVPSASKAELRRGRVSVQVPHASGLRVTVG
ncbi:MAG TPA: hypothetical protein VFU55_11155 [Terracidiphilus sp.]|nr:hypothetical protein [Terracidiphilus sp.]